MKNHLLTVSAFSCAAILAGCSSSTFSDQLDAKLTNPLFAEQYYDELVDGMVTLEIQNDDLTKEADTKNIIEQTRVDGLSKAKEANAIQLSGRGGRFVSDEEYSVGEVLLMNNALYIGPTFVVLPSPNLHIYLSTAMDPRDEGAFPDENAVDLGSIKTPYGDQQYEVSMTEEDFATIRSVVLWDESFKRIYGFVQLQTGGN